jgi:hypothetical protein
MQRRMSLAGTTGVLDGIQAAAVPIRRRRLRLLPYGLLAPSLLFLVLFTYLPVARVLVESFYDKPHGTGAATTFELHHGAAGLPPARLVEGGRVGDARRRTIPVHSRRRLSRPRGEG